MFRTRVSVEVALTFRFFFIFFPDDVISQPKTVVGLFLFSETLVLVYVTTVGNGFVNRFWHFLFSRNPFMGGEL